MNNILEKIITDKKDQYRSLIKKSYTIEDLKKKISKYKNYIKF